jgi:hypothetical protein
MRQVEDLDGGTFGAPEIVTVEAVEGQTWEQFLAECGLTWNPLEDDAAEWPPAEHGGES